MAFIGNLFFLGIQKKSYQFINLDDKQLAVNNLPNAVEIGANPFIKGTD
jgi:hypothetical protein